MQKCMYCGREIDENSVLTVCHSCGTGVWGEKMFNTIKKNMEDAKDSGDLLHMQDNVEVKGKSRVEVSGDESPFFSL